MRNSLVMRAPIFLRDNFGLELFLSNNDLAGTREEDAEAERYQRWHPGSNAAVAAELARVGRAGIFWPHAIGSLWAGYAATQAASCNSQSRASGCGGLPVGWWPASVCWLSWGSGSIDGRRQAKPRLAGLLIFPLPYYVIQFNPRYTYPVLWLAALMAGDVCFRLARRFMPARSGLGASPSKDGSTTDTGTRRAPRSPACKSEPAGRR